MSYKEKLAFRVPGSAMGLNALARRFEVQGDPTGNHIIHLELGERIFGDEPAIREALLIERQNGSFRQLTGPELSKVISDSGVTPATWVGMSYKEKRAFRVPGSAMGLTALATRLGVKGNPIGNHIIHLELGEKIFGVKLVT
jgi:hypothetical protein